MEQTATVEQAEPQGSAAPGQDTSASASGDNGAATPASFGTTYRQHVETRAARQEGRANASSADRETNTADVQPAPSTQGASRPGASTSDVDGTASPDADSAAADKPPPGLSRTQRKAWYTARANEITLDTADPPATSTAQSVDDNSDPVVARVERVEKTVTEGLSRLEGLLKNPTPAEADASLDGDSKSYATLFGDDAEFNRRAQIALHGSTTGQYLDQTESDELAMWAARREARDFSGGQATRQTQSFFSTAILTAAAEFGIDPGSLQKPGTTFRDIFGAFVTQGETKKGAELTAATEKLAKLEAAIHQLADENEALLKRLPASARSVLHGGASATSRAAHLADRSQMDGRQAMRSGLEQREQRGRSSRPGAR